MEFEKIVNTRRAVRSFDSKRKIPDEELKKILEMANMSPSSYNLQPWEFIVVKEDENKKLLAKCAFNQKHIAECSVAVIILANIDPKINAKQVLDDRIQKGLMDDERKKRFEQSIKALSRDENKSRLWATKSTALASMTLMYAAKSLGINSCPIEGYDAEMLKKEFGVPKMHEIVMIVALGYLLGKEPQATMRFSLDKKVHDERF